MIAADAAQYAEATVHERWREQLRQIAGVNRSRAVIHEAIGFVSLMGDEMDLEITELLVTSLLPQATRALVAAGRSGQSRSRSYRHSFLVAYAGRIGERLAEAAESVVAAHDDRLLPVLVDRRKAVAELFLNRKGLPQV
ncbi:MAG TPA: hypothetical protein VL652_30825 [Kutzneria sp.]|nr:hypothetical protein [Kutzneria sp.]